MCFLLRAAALLLVFASLQGHAAGDASAGQAKSAICAACHGADGNSMVPNWPKLAGQHEQYLDRQAGKHEQNGSGPEQKTHVAISSNLI